MGRRVAVSEFPLWTRCVPLGTCPAEIFVATECVSWVCVLLVFHTSAYPLGYLGGFGYQEQDSNLRMLVRIVLMVATNGAGLRSRT